MNKSNQWDRRTDGVCHPGRQNEKLYQGVGRNMLCQMHLEDQVRHWGQ